MRNFFEDESLNRLNLLRIERRSRGDEQGTRKGEGREGDTHASDFTCLEHGPGEPASIHRGFSLVFDSSLHYRAKTPSWQVFEARSPMLVGSHAEKHFSSDLVFIFLVSQVDFLSFAVFFSILTFSFPPPPALSAMLSIASRTQRSLNVDVSIISRRARRWSVTSVYIHHETPTIETEKNEQTAREEEKK